MRHEIADRLGYCHEALDMQRKLLDAGYNADVEAWDVSESDSEESDDEDLTRMMMISYDYSCIALDCVCI